MQTLWNGFACEEFEFEGYKARVVFPEEGKAAGKLALKTLYWGAFADVEVGLLKNGYHLAYLERRSRFPSQEESERTARFVQLVSEKNNLNGKCVLVGMSLGGAYAMRFAYYHPELVSCIYLDAPVLNYCDFPARVGIPFNEQVWENEFLKVFPGMKRYQMMGFREHPMDAIDTVKAHKIPVLLVYGEEDCTVPYKEHGLLMEQAYEGSDLLKIVPVAYRGHHPHGKIKDNSELVQYILENS